MELFQKLGADVEKLWRDKNYDEENFPSIAAQALAEADLPSKVTAWEVVDWTLKQTNLPEQRDLPGRFGDPPITLYNSPRFHVDVYFWLDGTTSIHQHAFCGAFQVLHGSSIHSEYGFAHRESVNIFTEIGDINLLSCELLQVGNIREIASGRKFIHALFHLDQPSATIVVRTFRSPLHLPQFDYRKPALAVDPFFEEPNTTKKLQSISMLFRSRNPEADTKIEELLNESDFQTSYIILGNFRNLLAGNKLDEMFNLSATTDRFNKLFEVVRKRHGALAEILPPVFAHQDVQNSIVQRRFYVKDPEHRFFLALLMNLDERENILSLVKARFPDSDPIEKILDWCLDLSQTRVAGLGATNALGIPDFDDMDLFVLENLLKNSTKEEWETNLKAEFGDAAENLAAAYPAHEKKLREATIFRNLLK